MSSFIFSSYDELSLMTVLDFSAVMRVALILSLAFMLPTNVNNEVSLIVDTRPAVRTPRGLNISSLYYTLHNVQ